MGLLDRFKKSAKSTTNQSDSKVSQPVESEYLDDVTYIREIKHTTLEPWHQYDVLLAARGYGWNTMKSWANYVGEADLESISEVTAGHLGIEEEDITHSFKHNGSKFETTPELEVEMGVLSIAGISKTLGAPVKIVWVNQTQILRIFTTIDNDALMEKYVETTIRQTFGTSEAMKRGKPYPQNQ